MGKSYEEIWGEPGHATPMSWLVPYEVTVRFRSTGEYLTVTTMMMSRSEWLDRVKRVTALHHGWDEDDLIVVSFEIADDDEDDLGEYGLELEEDDEDDA